MILNIMFFISHRGNLNGPNKKKENKIDYINKALKKKFDVENDKKNKTIKNNELLKVISSAACL